jgi:hypothetical protein
MKSEDEGHYREKHPQGSEADPRISEALARKGSPGEITCAAAFKIADELKTLPSQVGATADLLEARITKCQLGLFGYQPEKKVVQAAGNVSNALRNAIVARLSGGRLTCRDAWAASKELGIKKMEVSSACEALEIKISSCQLGAF